MILLGFIAAFAVGYWLVVRAFDTHDRRKARRQAARELREEPW